MAARSALYDTFHFWCTRFVVVQEDHKSDEGMVKVWSKDGGTLTTLIIIKGAPVAKIQMTESTVFSATMTGVLKSLSC